MKRYLLDTHTFLWFIWGDERLSQPAKEALEDAQAARFLSRVSLWQMAIKVSLGKRSLLSSSTQRREDEISLFKG